MKYLILVLAFVTAACAHRGYWPSDADHWRGKTLAEFSQKYGAPYHSQQMNERGDILHVWGQTYSGDLMYADCETGQSEQIECAKSKQWTSTCTYRFVYTSGRNMIITQAFLDGDCSRL